MFHFSVQCLLIFNHSIIFESCGTMAITPLGREHFGIYFWHLKHLVMKLRQLIDIVMSSIFRNKITFVDWVLNVGAFLFTNLPRLIKNNYKFAVCTSLEVVEKSKNGASTNYHQIAIYCHFVKIGSSFKSELKMFFMSCANI